jgi:putative MATE family efflux protein
MIDPPGGRALNRRIAALAIPSVGALAAEPLYVLADTAIVGHIGTNALASLAIAGTLLTTMTWMFGFLSMATTTNLARSVGAHDRAQTRRIVIHAGVLAVAIGTALAIIVAIAAPLLVRLMGADDTTRSGSITYLRIAALGLPLQLFAFVGHAWWRAHEKVRRSLTIVVVANVTNVGLEVLFVYGFGWGLAGSAWGTVIAQVMAGAMLAIGIARTNPGEWRPVVANMERNEFANIVRPGLAIVVRTGGHVSVLLVASAAAARLGTVPLAAHQLGMQLYAFCAFILDALAVPAQVLSSQARGAGQPQVARLVVRRTLVVAAWVGLGIAVALVALRTIIPRAFTDDVLVRSAASTILVLLALNLMLGAVAFVLDGALFGASDYQGLRNVTLMAAVAFWPLPPLIIAFGGGLEALWWALVWWMTIRTALIAWRWRHLDGGASMAMAPS